MFVLNSASDCNCQLLNWFWQYCGSPSQGRQPQAQRSADHWTLRAKPWAHAQHLSLDHQKFSYIPVKHIPVPRQWKHRDNWTLGMHGVAISSSRMLAFDRWHPQTQISALMTKNKSIEIGFSAQRANNRVQCLGTTIPFITFIPLLSDSIQPLGVEEAHEWPSPVLWWDRMFDPPAVHFLFRSSLIGWLWKSLWTPVDHNASLTDFRTGVVFPTENLIF